MIELPKGQLLDGDDGTLTAHLRASRPARRDLRSWFDRLGSARPRHALGIKGVDDGPRGFEIYYDSESRGTVPLAAAIADWRLDLPAALPLILDLGRFAFEVAHDLAARGFDDALIAPGVVRLVPESPDRFRLVPLPTQSPSVADWARADPEAWSWNAPEVMLGRPGVDPGRAIAAALHQALAGAIFPEALPAREKFARLIRGRVTLPARLGAAVRNALPRSMEEEAIALERFILDGLDPPGGPRPSLEEVRDRFDAIAGKCTTERLVRHWGSENRQDVVARLSKRVDPPRAPEPTPSPADAPWDELVPKRVAQGDLAGAMEAAWNDILENGPPRIRFYLAVVQRVAGRSPGPSGEVGAAIERLLGRFGDRLDESDVLRLAHIRLRHLGEAGARLGIAHRKFEGRWNDATARLLQARLLLGPGPAYNQVSRLCKEARALYEAMPEKGGGAGLYATAYLHLLDGIANVGAVGTYKNESFYADAFAAFGRALDLAGRANADDLIRACLGWLGWLSRFTRISPEPSMALISAGIDGVLRSHGLSTEALASSGLPAIPWYDESRLFPT